MTLTEFLLARIAERKANVPQLDVGLDRAVWHEVDEALAEQEAFSRQWLAECEALRLIVAWAEDDMGDNFERQKMLPLLAIPYADHPDYREEWRS